MSSEFSLVFEIEFVWVSSSSSFSILLLLDSVKVSELSFKLDVLISSDESLIVSDELLLSNFSIEYVLDISLSLKFSELSCDSFSFNIVL